MPMPRKSKRVTAKGRAFVVATFPIQLRDQIDKIAVAQERPRSQIIELACRAYVEQQLRRAA